MGTMRVVGGKGVPVVLGLALFTVMVLHFLLVSSLAFAADDSVCARVQIEIQQELTLERQAFDAHMRIHNGRVAQATCCLGLKDKRVEDSQG